MKLSSFLVIVQPLLHVNVAPQELLNRTALETQKLELMTEVSSLKLKLSTVERDHRGNEVEHLPRNVGCKKKHAF